MPDRLQLRAAALAAALAFLSAPAFGQADPPPAPFCDRLAAHPFDPDRIGDGVPHDRMDGHGALTACRAAVAAEPSNLRLVFQLGRALERLERADEALPLLRRAAEGGNVAAMHALAEILLLGNGPAPEIAEGVTWLQRSNAGGFAPAMVMLGDLYSEGRGVARDDAAAERFYRQAVETGNPFAQASVAMRLQERGNDPALEAEAERLLRSAAGQGWRDAYNELAWFLYMRGRNLEEAERYARRALVAYPDDGQAADTLGAILLRRGAVEEALGYLEFAVASEGDNPEVHARYGDALWALGRRDDARAVWTQALAYPQTDAQRAQLRERIARPQ